MQKENALHGRNILAKSVHKGYLSLRSKNMVELQKTWVQKKYKLGRQIEQETQQ